MVKTGYISFVVETGGGQDANGNPIASTKVDSEFFNCNLKVLKKEYVTLIDGQYQQAKYSVYIEQRDVTTISIEGINEIKLQDNNENDLGSFQIHNREYLNLTNKIKIVV